MANIWHLWYQHSLIFRFLRHSNLKVHIQLSKNRAQVQKLLSNDEWVAINMSPMQFVLNLRVIPSKSSYFTLLQYFHLLNYRQELINKLLSTFTHCCVGSPTDLDCTEIWAKTNLFNCKTIFGFNISCEAP